MNLIALGVGIALFGGLWPFGGHDVPEQSDATIGDLKPRELRLKMEPGVQDGGASARAQYRTFIEVPDAPAGLKAEAMRRLADLSVRAGEMANADGGPDASFYQDAIGLYEQLLAANPDYPDRDLILYQLARAHEVTGDSEAALTVLDQLVKLYPDSRFLDEAQFRRGEILFVDRRYREAEQAYAAVISAGKQSTFYEQSLYKHGWSLFKQGLYQESLDSFLSLLDGRLVSGHDGLASLQDMSRAERELVDDSFRVMAIGFSYMDGVDSINRLLAERTVAYSNLLYESLGDLYLEQERFTDAAETYRAFVDRNPVHPAAPGLQLRVAEAWTQGRFPNRVLQAKEDYVQLYGLDSPFWVDRLPEDFPVVVAQLKQALSDLASYDHARAQAEGSREAYERAAGWYRRYLAYFPADPDSAQRSFLLAEILNELGRYGEATEQYLDAAYAYGPHERAGEAAYAALLTARAHEAQLEGDALSAWHERMIDESLHFAESFPEHEYAGLVRVKVAEELYGDGQLDKAVDVAGLVVTMQPPVAMDLERTAWTVMAHAQFDLGRYAEAEQAYRRLQLMPIETADKAAAIEQRIAASIYRQGEQARDAGRVDEAVAQFLRVAEAAPNSDIVATATYDAAALLISTDQAERAIPVLQQFRANFPDSALNDDVTQKLAVAHQVTGQGLLAATEYEQVASLKSVDDATRREALWMAAELYSEAGRADDERRVYEQIVKRFPAPLSESIEARQKLVQLASDPNDRRHWLQEIVQADASAGQNRTARTRTLAATASLELAAPLRDAFYAAPLTIPLKESLKIKKSRMELALAAYGKAVDYGVAEVTTAASFEIGELYYRLSQDLIGSQRPPGLNEDELEQYGILLEEQAFPFEEQAIDIFEANASRAADGVYDEWVRRSFSRLAELMPGRYGKSERSERFVAQLD